MKNALKDKTNATAVRAVSATAVLVPLAALAGKLAANHNETVVRDRLA